MTASFWPVLFGRFPAFSFISRCHRLKSTSRFEECREENSRAAAGLGEPARDPVRVVKTFGRKKRGCCHEIKAYSAATVGKAETQR